MGNLANILKEHKLMYKIRIDPTYIMEYTIRCRMATGRMPANVCVLKHMGTHKSRSSTKNSPSLVAFHRWKPELASTQVTNMVLRPCIFQSPRCKVYFQWQLVNGYAEGLRQGLLRCGLQRPVLGRSDPAQRDRTADGSFPDPKIEYGSGICPNPWNYSDL